MLSHTLHEYLVYAVLDVNWFQFWFPDMPDISPRLGRFEGSMAAIWLRYREVIVSSGEVGIGTRLGCSMDTSGKTVDFLLLH